MQCVVETRSFRRAAEEAGMTEDEVMGLKNLLAENPGAGDLMVGTGSARKVRYAKAGRGKSGSYRVITYYTSEDIPVFLMDVYSKGQKINLTQRERADLKKELESFAAEYRTTIRNRVAEMKRSGVAS